MTAVAHVLLHGTREGRACGSVLYLDSDAHVSNLTMSIDVSARGLEHAGLPRAAAS